MGMLKVLFLILFFLTACGGLKEAGKVLRNEKVKTTDEFLVKKKGPLIMPPDYNKIPSPDTQKLNEENQKDKIKKILKAPNTNNNLNKSSSSTEQSILEKIRK